MLFHNLKLDCKKEFYRLRYGEAKQLLQKLFFPFNMATKSLLKDPKNLSLYKVQRMEQLMLLKNSF